MRQAVLMALILSTSVVSEGVTDDSERCFFGEPVLASPLKIFAK
jgi:hypothetical protein